MLSDRGYYDYPKLENSLFDAVKLVKIVDLDKHRYSGYGTGFDRRANFSVANGFGRNVIISRVDMSSSVHNKKKDFLILYNMINLYF